MKSERRRFGDIGEEITCKFLESRKSNIIERNYLRKWGEIDIIAEIDGKIHFVEVKTVSFSEFSRETLDSWNPEDNIHPWKMKRLSRTIQIYLLEKDLEVDWQFDVAVVVIDEGNKKVKVKYMENIVL